MKEHSKRAILMVDPLNDFMSIRGAMYAVLRPVSKKVQIVDHLKTLLSFARMNETPIYYAPHFRYRPGVLEKRRYLNPTSVLAKRSKAFNHKNYRGQFYKPLAPKAGEFVASEHMTSSGFVHTNLHEKLQADGINHIVLAGYLSNTCIESTARSAIDLGYKVTIISDAVSTWSLLDHKAAIEGSYPRIAHQVMTVKEYMTYSQREDDENAQ